MLIYCAHPVTREYVCQSTADPDPLTEGGWLIPAHAYADPPPAIPAGQAAQRRADGSGWQLVADHRGTVYSTATGAPQQHAELGELPDGLTAHAPPSPYHTWRAGGWVLNEAAKEIAEEAAERAWRDAQLKGLFAIRDRHRDEMDLGVSTTLTPGQFAELLAHIQSLRAWPQSERFPAAEYRPSPPSWYQFGE